MSNAAPNGFQPTNPELRQHTPTPWKVGHGPNNEVEIWGRMRMNASPILMSLGVMEHDPREANAAFIVEACNSHASLKARAEQAERSVDVLESNAREQAKLLADTGRRVEELEGIARQSRAAMLRTRTASIAGCEEGYGKPEKWGDELFQSHGGLTAAIKAIDATLSQSGGVARAPTDHQS